MSDRIHIYRLKLVRDRSVSFPPFTADQPQLAALFIQRWIGCADREHSAAVFLDPHRRVTGASIIGVGSLTQTPMPARELFKAALLANAASIILAHNHVASGPPQASRQDVALTKMLTVAAQILGLKILDHIIVSPDAFTSMRELGLLRNPNEQHEKPRPP